MVVKGLIISSLLSAVMLCGQQPQEPIMGMGIERVTAGKGEVSIVTTGAKFVIQSDGVIAGWQRIPFPRKVLEVRLPATVLPCELKQKNNFYSTVGCRGATLTLQGDSVVIFKLDKVLSLDFRGLFNPSYQAEKDGKWLLIDPHGGFGIYPVEKKHTPLPAFNSPAWAIPYRFSKGEEVWLSVFPPRPYNCERALEPIDHEGLPLPGIPGSFEGMTAYPSNELIGSAAKHCKVFTLHALIWKDVPEEWKEKTGKYAGFPQPWLSAKHVPADMKEFVRVREQVHKHGMKLVVYVSPFYSKGPDIFAEMERVLDEYKVDGLYFDGVSMDFQKSYAIMRRARQILGDDRILYVHCTADPLGDGRIYCPFIDTYADYILRGESGRFGLPLETFLRWTLSGYTISNAIGYWCYYGSLRQTQSDYIVQVPTTKDINIALKNEVCIWRQGDAWGQPALKGDLARFDEYYYRKLASLCRARKSQQ